MDMLSVIQFFVFFVSVLVLVSHPKFNDMFYWVVVIACTPLAVICIRDLIQYVIKSIKK